jgi:hypothetical protein
MACEKTQQVCEREGPAIDHITPSARCVDVNKLSACLFFTAASARRAVRRRRSKQACPACARMLRGAERRRSMLCARWPPSGGGACARGSTGRHPVHPMLCARRTAHLCVPLRPPLLCQVRASQSGPRCSGGNILVRAPLEHFHTPISPPAPAARRCAPNTQHTDTGGAGRGLRAGLMTRRRTARLRQSSGTPMGRSCALTTHSSCWPTSPRRVQAHVLRQHAHWRARWSSSRQPSHRH